MLYVRASPYLSNGFHILGKFFRKVALSSGCLPAGRRVGSLGGWGRIVAHSIVKAMIFIRLLCFGYYRGGVTVRIDFFVVSPRFAVIVTGVELDTEKVSTLNVALRAVFFG